MTTPRIAAFPPGKQTSGSRVHDPYSKTKLPDHLRDFIKNILFQD
jgi:hypothetical protein